MRRRWLKLLALPERVFLFFASVACVILVALIPPLAGGNETNNFQRVATIAAFHPLVEPAPVPEGVARLLAVAGQQFPEGAKPPYSYSFSKLETMASIPLNSRVRTTLSPNAIAVLNPAAYLPQVVAYWLGVALGASPLILFYLGRISGAIAALTLTYFAIRRMPVHRYALAAFALLPTIVFSRSTLDADQLTNALAFYFAANVFAAMLEPHEMSSGTFAKIAVSAFFVAQCKSAYLVLPLLALAIPVARYGSRQRWVLASALIVLPGLALSLAWILALKYTFFAGLHYHTWAGDVYPDGQMARVLGDPLSYLGVLMRTLLASNLLPTALLGFLGIFGPPVGMPIIFYVALLAALVLVLMGDGRQERIPVVAKLLAIGTFTSGFLLILTLLYVQWDGIGAPVITGFQGRYLYPLAAPLLILLPRTGSRTYLGLGASAWTCVLAATGLFGTVLVTWTTYWA